MGCALRPNPARRSPQGCCVPSAATPSGRYSRHRSAARGRAAAEPKETRRTEDRSTARGSERLCVALPPLLPRGSSPGTPPPGLAASTRCVPATTAGSSSERQGANGGRTRKRHQARPAIVGGPVPSYNAGRIMRRSGHPLPLTLGPSLPRIICVIRNSGAGWTAAARRQQTGAAPGHGSEQPARSVWPASATLLASVAQPGAVCGQR